MQDFAERYDTVMVPTIFRPWARELIRRLPPRDGHHILDLACGTGAVTREIAATGITPGSLTGADHSPGMLAVARDRATSMGLTADWVEADAAALPFPDASFDRAYCQQALQFFPDRAAALADLHRTLAPDGAAIFCVSTAIDENPLLHAQAAALETHVGPEAAAAVRAICALSDPDTLHDLFKNAGFTDITLDKVTLDLSHPDGRAYAAGAMGGMHTGDKLSALTEAQRQACFDDFLAGLGDGFNGTAIHFPHVSHVITARA